MSLAERNGWDQEPGWKNVEIPPVPMGGVPRVQPVGAVGDINSTAKGSGARFNAGKPPLALIPLRFIALSYPHTFAGNALLSLARWQEDGNDKHLYEVLRYLGLEGWPECARVFDYGKRKYAEWNWAKGMAWSIPMECAARHLLAILDGQEKDPESGESHRGHVFCNIVMLLTFLRTFPEGDDRPRCLAAP